MNRSTSFDGTQDGSLTVKCPLCGKDFDKNEAICSNCPFRGKCEIIRCPSCGYEYVAESKIVNFFKNLFKKRRRYPCPPQR